MISAKEKVSAFDRLSFTVFLALAIHALIIFGINFTAAKSVSKSPTLDVTLSLHKTEDNVADDDADFLSDANQQGSGTLEEKALLKSTEQADIEDNQIFHTTPTVQQIAFAELSQQNDRIISTTSKAEQNTLKSSEMKDDYEQPVPTEDATQLENITDVATLKAMLDDSRQSYAKRPRVRTLTAVSAKKAVDAAYIFNWLEKVERIGNQNYPESARLNRLTGSVRLAVTISADGSLQSVVVNQSSGYPVLDQAAKRIVHLSAPFERLSPEILQGMNSLEIIRTWNFRVDNRFEAQSAE
ncbi:energy transducer TonB [Reinekea marinisedimentorum]|uniref:Protein TonB n=1 Tax=Reinekea marinisedimentorum TaxID=230495 RepID=A0A4R3IB62_9GAMM|nr:energy transducer TonB [Reinekea marinisedimentorum]TCS43224.1 protein TonB [Reinekea marinisedimentorum]